MDVYLPKGLEFFMQKESPSKPYFGSHLSDWSEGRNNSFDFVRFVFAVVVLFDHCFVLTFPRNFSTDYIRMLFHGQTDEGALAVNGFFAISGFLITVSWFRCRGVLDFLRKRVLRIHPGLIAATVFCVFIAAPAGAEDALQFIRHVHILRVMFDALTLRQIGTLPPTFLSHASDQLNGSLWTIRIEFECYLLLPLFALFKMLRRKESVLILTIITWIGLVCIQLLVKDISSHQMLESIRQHLRFTNYFLSGMCFYLYRESIRISVPYTITAIAGCVLASIFGGFNLVLPILGVYLLMVFTFAPSPALHRFAHRADLSYGVYLYAWPIKQLVLEFLGVNMNPYVLFVIAFPATCIAAAFSWFLVEKPCLRLKGWQPAR